MKKPLALPTDIIYQYDGSLAGFYCCVYDSVYLRQLPFAVQPVHARQGGLFPSRSVETDVEHARRVRDSIYQKISSRAQEIVENVFYSCLEGKETALLRFILRAYAEGGQIVNSRGDPDIAVLLRAEGHLLRENHLLTGFIRFSDQDGVLVSTITPKNFVLPFLAPHFTVRFAHEDFLIYDRTHKAALLHQGGRAEIVEIDRLELNPPSEEESGYRALWKRFYNIIAIEARINPRCRMSHMPKRYWENMTEMRELL